MEDGRRLGGVSSRARDTRSHSPAVHTILQDLQAPADHDVPDGWTTFFLLTKAMYKAVLGLHYKTKPEETFCVSSPTSFQTAGESAARMLPPAPLPRDLGA